MVFLTHLEDVQLQLQVHGLINSSFSLHSFGCWQLEAAHQLPQSTRLQAVR